jgi:hypothetical protein
MWERTALAGTGRTMIDTMRESLAGHRTTWRTVEAATAAGRATIDTARELLAWHRTLRMAEAVIAQPCEGSRGRSDSARPERPSG